MSRVSEFIARKRTGPGGEAFPVITNSPAEPAENAPDEREVLDPDRVASSIGEETEGLRLLMRDVERKIGELDSLKDAFSKTSEPFAKTLRMLEQEKMLNVGLQSALGELRTGHDRLRADHHALEKKAAASEAEGLALREELERSQQTARAIETSRLETADELAGKRTQIANLERQLAHETAERQRLADDNRAVSQEIADAEKRILQLESELAAAREKTVLLEDELKSLQKSLDGTITESARLSRRLSESDNELAAARVQIGKMASAVAEAEAERNRLATALDEANGRHQSETQSLNIRIGSLQSRAISAEKLLAEVRQTLTARTEEARNLDRKAVEVTIALNAAEKKIRQLESTGEAQERQIRDLEQARTAMSERNNALSRNLRDRDTALARSEETIRALTARVGKFEADQQVNQATYEKRVEELNAALHHERMERSVVEGALEAARRDRARLHGEGRINPAATAEVSEATLEAVPGPSVQP